MITRFQVTCSVAAGSYSWSLCRISQVAGLTKFSVHRACINVKISALSGLPVAVLCVWSPDICYKKVKPGRCAVRREGS